MAGLLLGQELPEVAVGIGESIRFIDLYSYGVDVFLSETFWSVSYSDWTHLSWPLACHSVLHTIVIHPLSQANPKLSVNPTSFNTCHQWAKAQFKDVSYT